MYEDSIYPKVKNKIDEWLSEKKPLVVAIDGRCASGKSTLAHRLEKDIGAEIIRADDFFLPVELRVDGRYEIPGGNIHYERIKEEVAPYIGKGISFEYGVFSCKERKISSYKKITSGKDLYIVEGAYSSSTKNGIIYDKKIFVDIDSDKQKKRIVLRNGKAALENFENKWIPLEEEYIKTLNIKNEFDLII